MKFGSCRSQLYDAQKVARARWDDTTDAWTDAARQAFETDVWLNLDGEVSRVLRAVDQLGVLFTQIRQDCDYTFE